LGKSRRRLNPACSCRKMDVECNHYIHGSQV